MREANARIKNKIKTHAITTKGIFVFCKHYARVSLTCSQQQLPGRTRSSIYARKQIYTEQQRERRVTTTDGTDARCTTEQGTAMERPAERRPRVFFFFFFLHKNNTPCPALCPSTPSTCVWIGQTLASALIQFMLYFLIYLRIWLRNM